MNLQVNLNLPDPFANIIEVTQEKIDAKASELNSRGNRVTSQDVIDTIRKQGKTVKIIK